MSTADGLARFDPEAYDPQMPTPPRIVTVGLSPVWQHILEFDQFQPGEVNRAARSTWCASGKSLNVALGIHHLGGQVVSICHAGGPTGESVKQEFAALGIESQWIDTAAPTRVCTTLLERSRGTTTELVENQPPLSADEMLRLREVAVEQISNADLCVLSGSLPAGCPATFYAELMQSAACRKVNFLIDARGPELLACLPHRPLLVKPNRDELSRTLGRSLATDDDLISGMQELNAAGAQWVVVTNGGEPVFVTSASETHCLPIVTVPRIINPIACGDALMAGVAWGLSQESGDRSQGSGVRSQGSSLSVLKAIHIGLHCAAQNAGDLLPCRLRAGDIPMNVERRAGSPPN